MRLGILLTALMAAPGITLAAPGAPVPFTEYEAEDGLTNGEVVGPDRAFTTLPSEASGRRAVRLEGVGGYVEFVLSKPANAVTVRYALPDSADGRGLDGAIAVHAQGERLGALKLTSRYSWYYGAYPFTNRPEDGKGHHFYDEARLLLGRTLPAGTRVRFVVETPDAAAWRIIDLADFEVVGPPLPKPEGALSVLEFGADPTGRRESGAAIQRAVDTGRRTGRTVWIDPGTYRTSRHIAIDRLFFSGAGPWHSVLTGDGVGLYGRRGGSRNVVLSDFAIIGEVKNRDDKAALAGIGGAMNDSVVRNLWIQHTKVGLWFDGPMSGITVRGMRILDQAADGLNFHRGVTDAVVEDSFVRNSGDDGLAAWSHRDMNARITFRRNTVVAPTLANGIAIYGGRDIAVEDNLVRDTVTQGGGLHLGVRFSSTPFEGRIVMRGNTTVRAGVMDPNWKIGVGAVWVYALDQPITGADIRIEDNALNDSSHGAVLFIGKPVSGVTVGGLRIEGIGVSACASGFAVVGYASGGGWEKAECREP